MAMPLEDGDEKLPYPVLAGSAHSSLHELVYVQEDGDIILRRGDYLLEAFLQAIEADQPLGKMGDQRRRLIRYDVDAHALAELVHHE